MQRIRSFWRSSTTASSSNRIQQSSSNNANDSSLPKQQSSFLQQAQNLISSYRSKQSNISSMSTSQFDDYLEQLSQTQECYRKFKQNYQKYKKSNKRSSSTSSLKPQLVKKCYQQVDKQYYLRNFQISQGFFHSTKKQNRQKQLKCIQLLDLVEVALFNQVNARFDEVLAVMRTIESLECLVQWNIERITQVRQKQLEAAKKVVTKQNKIRRLVLKKQNLNNLLKQIAKVETYRQFLSHQQKPEPQNVTLTTQSPSSSPKTSPYNNIGPTSYESVQQIKKQLQFYSSLKCCNRLYLELQEVQNKLKKSFSQRLNDLIYQYVVGNPIIQPYNKNFWDKFRNKNDILEEEKAEQQGTILLDQSVMIEDETLIKLEQAKLTLDSQTQGLIVKSVARGWKEGEYVVGGLKAALEKHIKLLHSRFLDDFREFCFCYLRSRQIQISNPSLPQLLQQFTLSFFTRCCHYYSILFQNIFYRLGSITTNCINYLIKITLEQGSNSNKQQSKNVQFTIEEKDKLTQILDGLMNVFIFVWKSINQKFIQVLEEKEIHQTNDIADFRTFIMVVEGFQEFLHKKILDVTSNVKCPEECFLSEKYFSLRAYLPLQQLKSFKKAKLLEYLSKMHKNALEVELKQSLQNQVWTPTQIPTFYYDSLHYIITGQSLNLRRNKGLRNTTNTSSASLMYDTSVLMQSMYRGEQSFLNQNKKPTLSSNFRIIRTQIIIENQTYKITQTILLLLEIVEDYMLLKQFYPEIQDEIGMKLSQLFRSYNASSLQLIVHAGAVVLGKIKTKSITAKHLALSTLCLRFCMFLLSCVKKRIQLKDYEKIYKDYQQHTQNTIRKLQSILKSKITQSLGQIRLLQTSPSKGTQSIVNSCKILHDILIDFFSNQTLRRIFTKEIVTQYLGKISSLKIEMKMHAQILKDDVNFFFNELKFLNSLIEGFDNYRVQAENIVQKGFESL